METSKSITFILHLIKIFQFLLKHQTLFVQFSVEKYEKSRNRFSIDLIANNLLCILLIQSVVVSDQMYFF